jgi:hypothetical protein
MLRTGTTIACVGVDAAGGGAAFGVAVGVEAAAGGAAALVAVLLVAAGVGPFAWFG